MAAVPIGSVESERTRRRALVLGLSILVHGLVLGWFAFRQDRVVEDAATPAVEIQLLDVAKLPRPPARTDDEDAEPPPVVVQPVFPVAPRYVGPPVDAGGGRERGVDLFGPVFADGEWPRPWMSRNCDPVSDPELSSPACRRELEIAQGVTRAYDPREGTDEFAREARRNEAARRYQDLPGTAGYPGLRCRILHQC